MSNRDEMVLRLRQELGDEGATSDLQTWSDAYLVNLVIEANDWYSRLFPREIIGYQDVAADARVFVLVAGTLNVIGVECPPGRALPQDLYALSAEPDPLDGVLYRQAWAVFGDSLYLRNPAAGSEVGSSYLVVRSQVSWSRPDPSDPWDGPLADEKLLIMWAAREAWYWFDGRAARLNRAVSNPSQATRFDAALKYELGLRQRRASSRPLEVQG